MAESYLDYDQPEEVALPDTGSRAKAKSALQSMAYQDFDTPESLAPAAARAKTRAPLQPSANSLTRFPARPVTPAAKKTVWEENDMPTFDPNSPGQRLVNRGIPTALKAIGFNVNVPQDESPVPAPTTAPAGMPPAASAAPVTPEAPYGGTDSRRPTYAQMDPGKAAREGFVGSMGPDQQAWLGKLAEEKGAPVSSKQLGYGGVTESKFKNGSRLYSNIDATGKPVDAGTPYVGADGTPTARWEDTQQYQDATLRTQKDKRDADMLSIAEQARTRSGAAGEREKAATIAALRLGVTKSEAPSDADLAAQSEAARDKTMVANLRQKISNAKTPEEAAALQQSYLTILGKPPKDYVGEVKGGSTTDEFGNKTENPGKMVNLLTGQELGQPTRAKTATRDQVRRVLQEHGAQLGLKTEQDVVSYLAAQGITVK